MTKAKFPLDNQETETAKPLPDNDEEIIQAVGLDVEALFETFREGNEPLESVVSQRSRRSAEFTERKKRAQRLAELMMAFTPQQQRFVTHYCAKDWDSLSEVMIRAGSTAKEGGLRQIAYSYLQKPEIKEAIVLMTYRKLEAEGVDRYDVIAMFQQSYNAAMADGKYKEANEAAQHVGTAIGMFSPHKSKNLTDMEKGQIGELNKVARATNLAGPIKEPLKLEGEATEASVDILNEDLANQLNIARSKLN